MENLYKYWLASYEQVYQVYWKTESFTYIKHNGQYVEGGAQIPIWECEYYDHIFKSPNHRQGGLPILQDKLSLPKLRWMIHQGKSGTIYVFFTIKENRGNWMCVDLFTTGDSTEECVILGIRKSNAIERMASEVDVIRRQNLHKIVYQNLDTKKVTVVYENKQESYLGDLYHNRGVDDVNAILQGELIAPQDIDMVKKNIDVDFLREYFAAGNKSHTFYYRRRLGASYHWVRQEIYPTARYHEGIPVLLHIVVDANRETEIYLDRLDKAGGLFSIDVEKWIELVNVLGQHYLGIAAVDLITDVLIIYKNSSKMPIQERKVGYSKTCAEYLETHENHAFADLVRSFGTPKKLEEAFADRDTINLDYDMEDGQSIRITLMKIDSMKDRPTRVFMYSTLRESEHQLKVETFGNFQVYGKDGKPIKFEKRQSKALLAYLVDRQGYPVTSKDVAEDVLEKDPDDLNAIKYVSTLVRKAMRDLEAAGFENVIIKEKNTMRINTSAVNCDLYHLLSGDIVYWKDYDGEYMREYSWAEDTNAMLLHYFDR